MLVGARVYTRLPGACTRGTGCAWVSHGDDMIILPGKPHMYSEAEAAVRPSYLCAEQVGTAALRVSNHTGLLAALRA